MISTKNIKKTTYSYMELEKWLEENKTQEASIEEIFDFFSKKFSPEDIIYLMDAYRMPKKEIEKFVQLYHETSPKCNELDFVYNLSKLYMVSEKDIIRRIQEINIIKREEKALNNTKKSKKRKK